MKRPVHIVYVCADRGVPIGGNKGASTHVAELARALVRRGASVRIVAARTWTEVDKSSSVVPVIDLNQNPESRAVRQALLGSARGERQHTRATEAYGILLNQVLLTELQRIHRHWPIDAIYERYSLWSFAAAGFAHAASIPYLLEVNAPLRREQKRYRTLDNARAAESLETYVFRSADHVLVPSGQLREYVERHGARSAGIRVVPNAADPELFSRVSLRPRRLSPTEFVIGFLGTLKPWHGTDDLLRAFRLLHRKCGAYRLLVVGDGPLRPELERAAAASGLCGVVEFTGSIDHARVPEVLARMDVATAPYPPLSGFYFSPLKLFEYMAAGVPVVASDIGQISEVLTHGRTALLHRPRAVSEMAAHIESLRDDPVLARRLAGAARRLVNRRYTWSHNADRVLRLIATSRERGRPSSQARAAGKRHGSR